MEVRSQNSAPPPVRPALSSRAKPNAHKHDISNQWSPICHLRGTTNNAIKASEVSPWRCLEAMGIKEPQLTMKVDTPPPLLHRQLHILGCWLLDDLSSRQVTNNLRLDAPTTSGAIAARVPRTGIVPVAQKVQPIWQPTCDLRRSNPVRSWPLPLLLAPKLPAKHTRWSTALRGQHQASARETLVSDFTDRQDPN